MRDKKIRISGSNEEAIDAVRIADSVFKESKDERAKKEYEKKKRKKIEKT